MRIWYLLAGLLLAPILGLAQDVPFFRNNRPTQAENVPYTPVDGADWTNPDPDDVEDALDKAADRIAALEASVPAADVAYTPAVATDWDGDADPGNADAALDQLAERVDDLEIQVTALETAAAKGRLITATVGAEVADVIAVTLEVDDLLGVDAVGAVRLEVGLFTDAFFQSASNSGSFAVADAGDGSIETSDGMNNRHIVLTGPSARVQLTVTDVGGASGALLYGLARVVGSSGVVSGTVRFLVQFN